eukprot:2173360-Prymnesium_polylepis.1
MKSTTCGSTAPNNHALVGQACRAHTYLVNEHGRRLLGAREEHVPVGVRVARNVAGRHERRHTVAARVGAATVRIVLRPRDDEGCDLQPGGREDLGLLQLPARQRATEEQRKLERRS